MSSPTKNPFRLLPSVEEVLARPEVAALGQRVSRELLTGFVRAVSTGCARRSRTASPPLPSSAAWRGRSGAASCAC